MPLKRYFKESQKISLKTIMDDNGAARFDALTCYLKSLGSNHIDLTIPYGTDEEERYPFDPAKKIELYSDATGIGVSVTGNFEKYISDKLVRVTHNSDLKMTNRRVELRCDAVLDLGYTKGRGKLKTLRRQWEKNIGILATPTGRDKLPKFPRLKVNLSATGIGFQIKAPITEADLCLLYIDLHDSGTPICALAEVVWRSEAEVKGRCMAGFQFLNILDSDRQRISRFVKQQGAETGKNPE